MPGWSQFVGLIESALGLLHTGLGSWGLAIILFTVAVKVLTWPLTSQQLKSSKVMRDLQPRLKELQEKYKDDKERQTQEMMKLYQEMGVNPLMGCLPMLIQMPIWFGLYRAILQLAEADKLTEGFLFLPTLACPSTTADICTHTASMTWPLDFAYLPETWPYLILPVLTVLTQVGVSRLMSPPSATAASDDSKGSKGKKQQEQDPTQAMMQQMTTIMPVMFGLFALQFPAGLALYWVTNNALTFFQYWVINREDSSPMLTLAPAGAAEGGRVIEVEVKPPLEKEEPTHAKSRRKRKKR